MNESKITRENESGIFSERGFSSPVHSSEFSLQSSHSSQNSVASNDNLFEDQQITTSDDISQEVISFLKNNPRLIRGWQSLAHSVGLSHRVEVIKARIRADGRDLDDHVEEFIREWTEMCPETATLQGDIMSLHEIFNVYSFNILF